MWRSMEIETMRWSAGDHRADIYLYAELPQTTPDRSTDHSLYRSWSRDNIIVEACKQCLHVTRNSYIELRISYLDANTYFLWRFFSSCLVSRFQPLLMVGLRQQLRKFTQLFSLVFSGIYKVHFFLSCKRSQAHDGKKFTLRHCVFLPFSHRSDPIQSDAMRCDMNRSLRFTSIHSIAETSAEKSKCLVHCENRPRKYHGIMSENYHIYIWRIAAA